MNHPLHILLGLLCWLFRKQQFILMLTSGLQSYRTPDKRPQPDSSTKGFSSATSKPWGELASSNGSPGLVAVSQYRPQWEREAVNLQKLAWFESRTQQLKNYLDSSKQIDHARVREIFGWPVESPPNEGIQQRILKDLSSKVRALIKENSELRGASPTEEVLTLRRQKADLERIIDQLRRGETAREAILSEENHYLREYINRRKDDTQRSKTRKDSIRIEEEEEEADNQPASTSAVVPPPSQAEIVNLRKYVMTYINTVIESNDEKLAAQQKYLQALQKRVAQLDKCDQMLTHLRFEKAVKLQESTRKSKNFTAGAPTVQGDLFQCRPDSPTSEPPPESNTKHKFFAGKTVETPPAAEQAGKEMAMLVLRSAQLQEELSTLQDKYEVQIQNHIRDSSDREELVITIQKLTAEKKDLKHQVWQLQQQVRAAEKRVAQLEKGVGKFRTKEELAKGFSLKEELAEIKKELMACGVDHFEEIEKEITQVFHERNRLQRELQDLQSSKAEESKFSTTQKQIFLLKQKNNQLQQTCRFYEQQINQYEWQLRQVSQENEERLAKDISRDFRQMRNVSEEGEGLKWPRLAHSCMLNSIARLENIERRLANSTTT